MTFVCQGIADQVKNTTTFERSVMAGVANVCMQRVAEMQSGDQLLGRRSDLPGCHGVAVADRLVSGDLEISRHDVVSCGGDLGVVHACYQAGESIGMLVETTMVRRRLAQHSVVVARTGALATWVASRVVLCTAWQELDGAELLVVCQ